MDESFNRLAQALIESLLSDHPEWDRYVEPYGPGDDVEAEEGSVKVVVPLPPGSEHRLEVILRGDTVEVVYDGGTTRARAERQFILPDGAETGEFVGDVRAFVREVYDGRLVVSGGAFVERRL